MKKLVSILSLLLAALLLLPLASCGKKPEQPVQADEQADVISFNRETDYDNNAAAPIMAKEIIRIMTEE